MLRMEFHCNLCWVMLVGAAAAVNYGQIARAFSVVPAVPLHRYQLQVGSKWQQPAPGYKRIIVRQITKRTTTTTTTTTTTSGCTSASHLSMSLVPLTVAEMAELISVDTKPTALQYAAYWGRTPRERYSRLVETFLVSILGLVFSYCLSFVLGGFVATILGALFLFWGVFTPQLKAAQRNWEFLGGRDLVDYPDYQEDEENNNMNWFGAKQHLLDNNTKRGLYGALFLGRLDRVCVVESADSREEYELEQFLDYTMESDEQEQYTGNPFLLRVRLADQQGRKLQVHARLSEEYIDALWNNDNASDSVALTVVLLLSKSPTFDELAALTDLYIPSAGIYIGDYPYLHREGIQNLLAMDDEIWNALQNEATTTTTRAVNHKENSSSGGSGAGTNSPIPPTRRGVRQENDSGSQNNGWIWRQQQQQQQRNNLDEVGNWEPSERYNEDDSDDGDYFYNHRKDDEDDAIRISRQQRRRRRPSQPKNGW